MLEEIGTGRGIENDCGVPHYLTTVNVERSDRRSYDRSYVMRSSVSHVTHKDEM